MRSPEDYAFAAARVGAAYILAKLLDRGVSPESEDVDGDTLLVVAVHNRRADCARLLLSRGARANGIANDGQPLWMASYQPDNVECIRALIEHGANPNQYQDDESRQTLLMHFAGEPSHLSNMVELLKHKPILDARNNEDESPLTYAIAWGNLEGVRLLLDAGVDVNARVCKGETALIVATGAHNDTTNDIINLLLDRGADVNIGSTGEDNLVPYRIPLMTYVAVANPIKKTLSWSGRSPP